MLACDWCEGYTYPRNPADYIVTNKVYEDDKDAVCEACKPKARRSVTEMYGYGTVRFKKIKGR